MAAKRAEVPPEDLVFVGRYGGDGVRSEEEVASHREVTTPQVEEDLIWVRLVATTDRFVVSSVEVHREVGGLPPDGEIGGHVADEDETVRVPLVVLEVHRAEARSGDNVIVEHEDDPPAGGSSTLAAGFRRALVGLLDQAQLWRGGGELLADLGCRIPGPVVHDDDLFDGGVTEEGFECFGQQVGASARGDDSAQSDL